jgi:hypothetical protein
MPSEEQLAEIRGHYRATARTWFKPAVTYHGPGRAVFVSNPGTIEGPVSISFREDGIADHFEMSVEALTAGGHPGEGAPDAVFTFVNAVPIPDRPGAFGFGGASNECAQLEVQGDGFSLSAANPLVSASERTATFRPNRTIVGFTAAVEPVYWVVPLLNFVSDFVLAGTELHGHPLRVRETPAYEPAGDDADRFRESMYRESNGVLPFDCEGELGFVEPLCDYADRRDRVLAGETLVTAIMVGRLPPGFSADDHDEWFPSDLLTLLALAGGREIGVSFVELRGAACELVARMHLRAGTSASRPRRPLVDESIDHSTGALLTAFLASPYRDRLWLRVALRHLQRALVSEKMTVEDRLGHLFRAVEGLAGGLELNRSRPLEMTAETRARVDAALQKCADQLQAIANEASTDDGARLEGVKTRIKGVQSNSPSFQTQLLDLVDHGHLSDAGWLRQFKFRAKIKGGPTSWAAVASQLRNRIFHKGFVNFEQYDIENILPFVDHLADVLCRVVFALIRFDSSYRPPCGAHGMVIHATPDWASPERLRAERFRYVP